MMQITVNNTLYRYRIFKNRFNEETVVIDTQEILGRHTIEEIEKILNKPAITERKLKLMEDRYKLRERRKQCI